MFDTTNRTGLFLARYDITTGMAGAPVMHLAMTVNTVDKAVNGGSRITQATNPPLDVRSHVHGSFTYMTVMPKTTHILVVATGYPIIHWPAHAGHGPVLLANMQLRMVLENDWKSGTANFSYQAPSGQWVEIDNARVTVPSSNPGGPIITLYGPALSQAAASGDRARMKELADQAEAHLAGADDVRKALDAVKAELAKGKKG